MTIALTIPDDTPVSLVVDDADGDVHAYDAMGSPWCMDEDLEQGGTPASNGYGDDPCGWTWCVECLDALVEEGYAVR